MRAAVLQRFHISYSGNPYEALMCLRQTGTVAEYRAQFETLSAPLRDAEEEIMQAAFLNGLRDEIRSEIRMHLADDVDQMMCRAQRAEEKDESGGRAGSVGGRNGSGFGSGNSHRAALVTRNTGPNDNRPNNNLGDRGGSNTRLGSVNGTNGAQGSNLTGNGMASGVQGNADSNGGEGNPSSSTARNNLRGTRFRRLSPEEEANRRQRNLCFRCDGPFGPGHVCPTPHLNVMLALPDDNWEGDDAHREPEMDRGAEVLQLSAHSVVGLTSNHSLKLWGEIHGRKVVVLIDSGASHNFLATRVVNEEKMLVDLGRDMLWKWEMVDKR